MTRRGLTICKLVTDRHRQLAKYIRETTPAMVHTWHVAKDFTLQHCIIMQTVTDHRQRGQALQGHRSSNTSLVLQQSSPSKDQPSTHMLTT
ncbi:hypothetical protein SKAU_G00193870 [Synaphobranchus kaupii]|uniref:Uncharacterized protein n=1 Tax=Synaphobranchus kaupii TaxID=118154 RepID=A0A9Q1FEJ4_SYNKA|nr:hypothetical protein SKAU_G00193870 [Synaphobranchus kaupii]